MHYEVLPNVPTTARLVRQEKLYREADVDGEVVARLPFATNVNYFFNEDAFEKAGINLQGFARQVDQVFKENLGNLWNAKIKKSTDGLPTQEQFTNLESSYDFSGVRAPSSEEGMSAEERVVRNEIRKLLRSYISGGAFKVLGISSVQSLTEVKKGELPAHKLDLDKFEEIIAAAYENDVVVVAETDKGQAKLDFSEDPQWQDEVDEIGNRIPENFSAIVECARELAQAELAKGKRLSKGPTVRVG